MTQPFWETKSLAQMTDAEWESLCDGCGKCCMVLLRDDEDDAGPGAVWETDVACRLFDPATRRCRDYANRLRRVPGCIQLTPDNAGALDWMPETCAYRRLAAGDPLPEWHPLVTGDPASTERAGAAVSPNLVSELTVEDDDLDDHIVRRRL